MNMQSSIKPIIITNILKDRGVFLIRANNRDKAVNISFY